MSEGKRFVCPSCGSALNPSGDVPQVKCAYCGTMVIVPPELRSAPSPTLVVQPTTSESEPAEASGGCRGLVGLVALFVIVFAVMGVVIFIVQADRSSPTPFTPIAKISPTPAGFAHVALSFGGEGTSPGLFQEPRYLAVDPGGTIYVGDYKTRRVQRFDPNGKYVSGWTVDGNLCSNKSATFNDIAADRTGNVYVSFCGLIAKYDGATGNLLGTFDRAHNGSGDFYTSVETIPDGNLLVLASGAPNANEVILRLDANGKVLSRMPNLITNQAERSANALTLKAAADGLGNLFVLNGDDYYIYKFTREGKYVNKFGGVGDGPGQFKTWAHTMALDNQSRIYVADFDGIKVLDSNGVYLDKYTERTVVGLGDLRIDGHNGIYFIGRNSTIFKLEWNGM